jgi:aspartyl-tRNA(Asn)/glutamyl-tRNA(Gln) amidotransferase subunit A
MATPRLKGRALRALRSFAETSSGGRIVVSQMKKDVGIDRLATLPIQDLPAPDVEPRPLQARREHGWSDARLGAPVSRRVTGRAVRDAYQSGAATPRDVLAKIFDRIDRNAFGKATNSPFTGEDREGADAAAAESAARWAARRAKGPLDGIPIVVKDQFHMVGLATRGGSSYKTEIRREDAALVTMLREAGALVYAKAQATEYGMSPIGFNANFVVPRNVYDSERAPGGSSTGSAIAAALGFATVTAASDGGGSVRTPAGYNGVFGLKPTYIRVSRVGDEWGNNSVSVTGPIGQSTEDLVDFLSVACGPDPRDPLLARAPSPLDAEACSRALGRGVKGAVIGVPAAEWADAEPAVARAGERALARLEADGCRLEAIDVPILRHCPAAGAVIIGTETMGNALVDLALHRNEMGDDLRVLFAITQGLSAHEYFLAQRVRSALRRALAAVLERVDVIALPTSAAPAPRYPLADVGISITDTHDLERALRYAFPANLAGLPAGQVPTGTSEGGLPVGMQLLGDAWDEVSILALMAHCERIGFAQLDLPEDYLRLVD